MSPSVTSLLRRARQSKHDVTTFWQMETFCCITTSPSPAPIMLPTRLPTVMGIIHQPSSQARIPRVAQVSVNSCMRARVRSGMAPSEWLIM